MSAFDQLKLKVANQGTATPTAGGVPAAPVAPKSAFEALKATGATKPAPAPAQQPQSDVKGGFIGELLTGNTQRFGKTIGDALAAPGNADNYKAVTENHNMVSEALVKKIHEAKDAGQDTTRLQGILKDHLAQTPKLEDFTGDVINKSAEQVIGEGIGTGLEALSGGILSGGAEAATAKGLSTAQKVGKAAALGATYGAIGSGANAMAENKDLGDVAKDTAIGTGAGALLGGGLGYAGTKISTSLANRAANIAERKAGDLEEVTGKILQGERGDIKTGQKVLSGLNVDGVKSYEDLNNVLNDKVKNLSGQQDKLLSTSKETLKLPALKAEITVGDKTTTHNFVKDALQQLNSYYTKTNDQEAIQTLKQFVQKATKQGITIQDINELARLHGKDLNGFNASGELASGLSKQSAENTRAGLKTTVRQLFGGTKSANIDRQITNTIKVRGLVSDVADKVNALNQKIQTRTLGEKAGNAIARVLNLVGFNSPKGFVEYFMPRGQGLKVLNPIDLENNLQKNLKLLQELADPKATESELLNKATTFLKEALLKPVNYGK